MFFLPNHLNLSLLLFFLKQYFCFQFIDTVIIPDFNLKWHLLLFEYLLFYFIFLNTKNSGYIYYYHANYNYSECSSPTFKNKKYIEERSKLIKSFILDKCSFSNYKIIPTFFRRAAGKVERYNSSVHHLF